MLPSHRKLLQGAAGGAGLEIRGVRFDGTNDYMEAGGGFYASLSDTKVCTFSMWIKPYGLSGDSFFLWNNNDYVGWWVDSAGKLWIQCYDSGGNLTVDLRSANGAITIGAWHHILISFKTDTGETNMYINGVDAMVTDTVNNRTVDWTRFDWYFSRRITTTTLNAEVAAVYINTAEYLDFSNSSNREKFAKSGYPVELGASAALPTGTAPPGYLHLADGDAVSSFATNKGLYGGWALTGTLTEATTPPSY